MPRQQLQEQWQRIRQQLPSCALSLAIHLTILFVAATITWIVLEPRPVDRVLTLAGDGGLGTDGGLGGGGPAGGDLRPAGGPKGEGRGAEGPVSGDRGSAMEGQAAGSSAVLSAALPLPTALGAAPESLAGAAVADLLPGAFGAASGVSLSNAMLGASGPGGGGPGGSGTGGPNSGLGLAIGPGTGGGPGLGGVLAEMRGRGLDVVLVLDATNSMDPYIEQGKKRLQQVIDVVSYLVKDCRFGLVAYKDYGDDFGPTAVRFLPITEDRQTVKKFLATITAGGGGDFPEPIHQALATATDLKKMGWGPGRKWVIILVGDSPVHASGRQAALDLARDFSLKYKGAINVIDVGGAGDQAADRKSVQPDLQAIAEAGGGSAFFMKDQEAFWRHLIVSVFGQRYEKDVNTIIQTLVLDKR